MKLRDYQQRAIDQTYHWMRNNTGNPCLVKPTGSGKSHIVAAICKDAVQNWPETRILMLTHVKELIEQNYEKMLQHWPNAPVGIYSAGVGRRELDQPITFAGIQSVRTKSSQIGHIDLIIIDECHLVSHKNEGSYRKLIEELLLINPSLRVIGLTATPYRLGHGLITDKPAIFDDIIEPISIEELVYKGYLSRLSSKSTELQIDCSGVKKRGGDYIEKDLQRLVDTDDYNYAAVDETIRRAGDRKSWLFFCSGVEHAIHVRDILIERGVEAACITGKTSKAERNRILDEYKKGKIQAVTNANVLTTGFDNPNIDLIVFLRDSMSPGLYVQMAGRGTRLKEHTDHCLVLDFVGLVKKHGPITNVRIPDKAGNGDAPVKVCDNCDELVAISAKECPECGWVFPEPEKKEKILEVHNDDIMGADRNVDMEITSWSWRQHTSRTSGKEMLACTYYGALSDKPVNEYFPILHDGYAGEKAREKIIGINNKSGADIGLYLSADKEMVAKNLNNIANELSSAKEPSSIRYVLDGKFARITDMRWINEAQQTAISN